MLIKDNAKLYSKTSLAIYLVCLYYFFLLISGVLIGQKIISVNIARGILLFITIPSVLMFYNNNIKFNLPEKILFIFSFVASTTGILINREFMPIMQVGSLLLIYLFVKLVVQALSIKDIKKILHISSYISLLYVLCTILAIKLFPDYVTREFDLSLIRGEYYLLGLTYSANLSATYMMTALFIVGLAFHMANFKHKVLFFITSLLILYIITKTGVRASLAPSIIFFVILININLFKYIISLSNKNKRYIISSIISIQILIALIFIYKYFPQITYFIFRGADNGRFLMWGCVTNKFALQNLFFGAGLGLQDTYLKQCGYEYLRTHNSFIDILLGVGIFNFMVFVLFVSLFLYTALNKFIKTKNSYYLVLFLIMSSLVVHSMVESYLVNKLSVNYFLYLLCFFLSLKNYNNLELK